MNKEEFAQKYIMGNMDDKEKLEFFQMLTKDDEFRKIYMEEKRLYKEMQRFRMEMDPKKADALFKNIMKSVEKESAPTTYEIVSTVLMKTMPSIVYEILKYRKKENRVYGL